ncbi:MAG: hypothetical protein ACMUJM_10300 [bacterium]
MANCFVGKGFQLFVSLNARLLTISKLALRNCKNSLRWRHKTEILQELFHVYLPVGHMATLDAALTLAKKGVDQVIPITAKIVMHARNLVDRNLLFAFQRK